MFASIIPMKIEKTRSLFCCTRSGPGTMPWMVSPPSMTAVVALPGIPMARSGIIEPPTPALFADSGATMPSGTPVPKRSG
jgi:hypothetical protein